MTDTIALPFILADDRAWSTALSHFDRGDCALLAALVREYMRAPEGVARCTDVPTPEVLDAVAAIIEGKRRPDRRGLRKQAKTAGERARAVQEFAHLREVRDGYMRDLREAKHAGKRLPRAMTKERLEADFARAAHECAARHGVTLPTLETWARQMK